MFLLVVVIGQTPDEGVVVLTDVGVGVLQGVAWSPQVREKNLLWNDLVVSVVRSQVPACVTAPRLQVSNKAAV